MSVPPTPESTAPSPDNITEKREKQAGCSALFFRLLRQFWLTELAVVAVTAFGLYRGWSDPKQWSNAFFYAGVTVWAVATLTIEGSLRDAEMAPSVRFIVKGDIAETRAQLYDIAMHKDLFAVWAFIGGFFIFFLSYIASRQV